LNRDHRPCPKEGGPTVAPDVELEFQAVWGDSLPTNIKDVTEEDHVRSERE
jgi:hypothetical protein